MCCLLCLEVPSIILFLLSVFIARFSGGRVNPSQLIPSTKASHFGWCSGIAVLYVISNSLINLRNLKPHPWPLWGSVSLQELPHASSRFERGATASTAANTLRTLLPCVNFSYKLDKINSRVDTGIRGRRSWAEEPGEAAEKQQQIMWSWKLGRTFG